MEKRESHHLGEDLGVEAVHALAVGMDSMMDDMNIDPTKYELAFQIGSKEHFKEWVLLEKPGTYLLMITINDQSVLNRC